MARSAEGWSLDVGARTGIQRVRFSHGGRRHKITTGERDPAEAARKAARIYADIVSGRRPAQEIARGVATTGFIEVAAVWLADVESSVHPYTFALYEDTYVGTHFAPYFETINRLTTVVVEDYVGHRLRHVRRETIKKELSVLRRLAKWAHRRGFLREMPTIELPGEERDRYHRVEIAEAQVPGLHRGGDRSHPRAAAGVVALRT